MSKLKSQASKLTLLALAAFLVLGTAESASAEQTFNGNASWYGVPFHGKKTASGEIFDMNKLSGAHKTLPLLTKVMVENPKTGKSAVVKVNDRGPYVKTRVMDLSRAGAQQLGYLSHGVAYLEFTVLPKGGKAPAAADAGKDSGSSTANKSSKSE